MNALCWVGLRPSSPWCRIDLLHDGPTASVVLAIPSLYEGFGLPAVEAMACGTPVVAGDIPALREVLGDEGVYVDPLDIDSIAVGLQTVVDDHSIRARMGPAVFRKSESIHLGCMC